MEIPIIKPLTDLTPYMISFFFVLSGFVMTLVYYHPGQKFHYRDFWIARISRIFPIHLLSLSLACFHYLDALGKIKALEYYSAVFLLQAWIPEYALTFNFPAWTLSAEMFFYLLFPMIINVATRQPMKRMIWVSIVYWAINQLFRQVLIHSGLNVKVEFIAYFPLLHLDAFLLGLVGGVWFLAFGKSVKISPWVNTVLMLVSVGVIIYFIVGLNVGVRLGAINGFFSPLFVLIILTLCFDKTWITRFLSMKWLVKLGESSYSLYIFHIPVLWIIKDFSQYLGLQLTPITLLFTYAPLMIGLSVVIFRKIEWPAQNWLRTNPHKIIIILVDMALITISLALAYGIRVGFQFLPHARSIQYSLRVGLPIIIIMLLIFRFYHAQQQSGKVFAIYRLLLPLLMGFGFLGIMMYWGGIKGWIEVFPRTFPIIGIALSFTLLYSSRVAYRRFMPSWVT